MKIIGRRNEENEFKPIHKLISLKGRRALITGAGKGIGRATSIRFAEAGADLELVDIDIESLGKLKEELTKFNVKVNIYKIDVSIKKEIDTLWEILKTKAPDVLVNNVGIYPTKPFLDVDEHFLKNILDTNLNSTFWMCQHMIRNRIKRGGVIINFASIEALLPFKKELAHYDMSKAGVIALTRALAHEYGKYGFRVNVIVPGGIWTPGTKKIAKDILKLKYDVATSGIEYLMRTPLHRMGKPDEVARMALVLACDMSSYVNGAVIVVDGGFLSA